MLVTIDIDKLQEEHVHLGIIRNNIVFNQAKFSRLQYQIPQNEVILRNLIVGFNLPLNMSSWNVRNVNDTAIEIQIFRTSHTDDIFRKLVLFEAQIKRHVDNICPGRRWRSLIQAGNGSGSYVSFRINVSESASVPVHQGRNIMNVPLDKFSVRSSLRKIWVRFNGIYWDANVCGINHKTILLAVRH